MKAQLAEATRQLEAASKRRGQHVAPMQGANMVIKRALGNVGGNKLGLVMASDIDKSTVYRWEMRVDAAMLNACRDFHASRRADLTSEGVARYLNVMHLSLVQYRADATNATVWQRQKLHALEGMVHYVTIHCEDEEQDVLNTIARGEKLTRFADVEVVHDHTGVGAFAMIGTQLKNMGAPVWSDDVSTNEVMVFMG